MEEQLTFTKCPLCVRNLTACFPIVHFFFSSHLDLVNQSELFANYHLLKDT